MVDRIQLWESFGTFGHHLNSHWLVVGDFNSVFNDCDQSGNVTSYEVRYFLNCCVDLGLNDLNSMESFFT